MTEVAAKPASDSTNTRFLPHTSHWGVFSARWQDGELEVRPNPDDPDPWRKPRYDSLADCFGAEILKLAAE